MLRQEMNLGYFEFIHRPGEKLGVLDNASDYEECSSRVHCNCTHGFVGPVVNWNQEKGAYEIDESGMDEALETFNAVFEGRRNTILGGGDHNNVYFPGFIHLKKGLPEALMQDPQGNYLELHDKDILGGEGIPMPGIDDPHITSTHAKQLAMQASRLVHNHYVAGYTLGSEMLYPEYFGLGKGDYRPASWAHFEAWCREQGEEIPTKEQTLEEGTPAYHRFLRFREQAMADRCRTYYKAVLDNDDTHLAYYPTHGSTLQGGARAALGQQPDSLASSCDGMEMGHILIDNDESRRNVILISHFSAFGAPVIVPRLGNKTADLSARGGGRSFTPETLRRLVYECAGLGISIIFPIHWRSVLHDGEWFIKNTPAEQECRRVFDELTLAAPYTNGMGRLQPQVGLFTSDTTWRTRWQPRWTGVLQDALCAHVNMTAVTDVLLGATLAEKMPVLVSVDNAQIDVKTLEKLLAYLNAGGKLAVWGAFAQDAPEGVRQAVLGHAGVQVVTAPEQAKRRVLRELFLAGADIGVDGSTEVYHGAPFDALLEAMERLAPEAALRPFAVESAMDTKDLNVYALTDRASMLAVCINNAPSPVTFALAPDKRLMDGETVAIDAVTGARVAFPMTLEGNQTRMIYFGAAVTDDEMEDAVCAAEEAFGIWRREKANVRALRHYYSAMRSGPWKERRYAQAQALLHSFAPIVTANAEENGTLRVECTLLDAQGKQVQGANVRLRTTPGTFETTAFSEENGKYVCRISAEQLPKMYDTQAREYRPIQGAVRLVIQAEKDGAQGGCIVTARV